MSILNLSISKNKQVAQTFGICTNQFFKIKWDTWSVKSDLHKKLLHNIPRHTTYMSLFKANSLKFSKNIVKPFLQD